MNQQPEEEKLREHSYDGIEEYDKNLPNWWLFTLYATIAFSIAYWAYYHKAGLGSTQEEEYALAMASIEAAMDRAKAEAGEINDEALRAMAAKTDIVSAGKQVYDSTCSSCHGNQLQGGIGVALNDSEWKHGSDPLQIKAIVADGVAVAGMPPWGPVLGDEKINQVVAYILSHHQN